MGKYIDDIDEVLRVNQLLQGALAWIHDHVDGEEEYRRVLTEHLGMDPDEFSKYAY